MCKKNVKKILFVGFGDLAKKCTPLLLNDGAHITGIARSENKTEKAIDFWQGDISDPHIQQKLGSNQFDIAVLTLTPETQEEAAYKHTYIEKLHDLTETWRKNKRVPNFVIFVSSTVVYGQEDGSWVNEQSETKPHHFRGKTMLEAESIIRRNCAQACILRFSGIYGPERNFLVRQVKMKKPGTASYANRIHVDDCIGIIRHLCQHHWQGKPLAETYLASDCLPEKSHFVRAWLASELAITGMAAPERTHKLGKQCSNKKLLETGYKFKYSNYREGYRSFLS